MGLGLGLLHELGLRPGLGLGRAETETETLLVFKILTKNVRLLLVEDLCYYFF